MQTESALVKSIRQDPGSSLIEQIKILAGDRSSVSLIRQRPWASATFSGTRHCLTIDWIGAVHPAAASDLAQILADHEFIIPGCFIADILITDQTEAHLRVEALSITDPVESDPFSSN